MSKLSKVLKAYDTGYRQVSKELPSVHLSSEIMTDHLKALVKYQLKCEISNEFVVSEEVIRQSSISILDYNINLTKQRIIEEIFGEFRMPLLDIRQAILNQDTIEAMNLLNDLYAEMFDPI